MKMNAFSLVIVLMTALCVHAQSSSGETQEKKQLRSSNVGFGLISMSDTVVGVQVGMFNLAKHDYQRGVQVGLVNFSCDTISKRYGLVNVNPKTRIDLMAFAGTNSKANMALRFRNRSTYPTWMPRPLSSVQV